MQHFSALFIHLRRSLLVLVFMSTLIQAVPIIEPMICAGDLDNNCDSQLCYDALDLIQGSIKSGCADKSICETPGCSKVHDQFVCCCSHSICNGKSEALIRARYGLYLSEHFAEVPLTTKSSSMPDTTTFMPFVTHASLPIPATISVISESDKLHELSLEHSEERADRESGVQTKTETKADGEKPKETVSLEEGEDVQMATDAAVQTEAIMQPAEGETNEMIGEDNDADIILTDISKNEDLEQVDGSTVSSARNEKFITEIYSAQSTKENKADASEAKLCSDVLTATNLECKDNDAISHKEVTSNDEDKENTEDVLPSTGHTEHANDITSSTEHTEYAGNILLSTEHTEYAGNILLSTEHTEYTEHVPSGIEHTEYTESLESSTEHTEYTEGVPSNTEQSEYEEIKSSSTEQSKDDVNVTLGPDQIEDTKNTAVSSGHVEHAVSNGFIDDAKAQKSSDEDIENGRLLPSSDEHIELTNNVMPIAEHTDATEDLTQAADYIKDEYIDVTTNAGHTEDAKSMVLSGEHLKYDEDTTLDGKLLMYDEMVSSADQFADDENVTSTVTHAELTHDMTRSDEHIMDDDNMTTSSGHIEDTEHLTSSDTQLEDADNEILTTLASKETVVKESSLDLLESSTVVPSTFVTIFDIVSSEKLWESTKQIDGDSDDTARNGSAENEKITTKPDRQEDTGSSENSLVTKENENDSEKSTHIHKSGIYNMEETEEYDDKNFGMDHTSLLPDTSAVYAEESSIADIESNEHATSITKPFVTEDELYKDNESQDMEPTFTEMYKESAEQMQSTSASNPLDDEGEIEQHNTMSTVSEAPIIHDTDSSTSENVQAKKMPAFDVEENHVAKESPDKSQKDKRLELQNHRDVAQGNDSAKSSPSEISSNVSTREHEKQAKLYEKKILSWKGNIIPWWVVAFIGLLVIALFAGIIYRTFRKRKSRTLKMTSGTAQEMTPLRKTGDENCGGAE